MKKYYVLKYKDSNEYYYQCFWSHYRTPDKNKARKWKSIAWAQKFADQQRGYTVACPLEVVEYIEREE
jgi:hypothetical protein